MEAKSRPAAVHVRATERLTTLGVARRPKDRSPVATTHRHSDVRIAVSRREIGMPRLMSEAVATDQVRRRKKTVTRRVRLRMIGPGAQITLCPKVRGLRREELERIVTVDVVSARRERLD